jgi:hypothetical protein
VWAFRDVSYVSVPCMRESSGDAPRSRNAPKDYVARSRFVGVGGLAWNLAKRWDRHCSELIWPETGR